MARHRVEAVKNIKITRQVQIEVEEPWHEQFAGWCLRNGKPSYKQVMMAGAELYMDLKDRGLDLAGKREHEPETYQRAVRAMAKAGTASLDESRAAAERAAQAAARANSQSDESTRNETPRRRA